MAKKHGSDMGYVSLRAAASVFLTLSLAACTGQLKDSFRFKQAFENFGVLQEVNTKIDLLWVVDNSASMDVSQDKLRKGMASFANAYLKTYWDIRIAVIPTDLYLANHAFDNYVAKQVIVNQADPEQTQPAHMKSLIQGRIAAVGVGAISTDPVLVSLANYFTVANDNTAGTLKKNGSNQYYFPLGLVSPGWLKRQEYGKLKSGIHDGPMSGLCASAAFTPYFFNSNITNCTLRDDAVTNLASTNVGTANCLDTGQNGVQQCVNTFANDTVRSGFPMIQTQTPTGYSDAAWAAQIVDAFMVNATTGSTGHGSERGMSSVLEFININEADAVTKFFRKDSLRGIIFLGDEDDQSTELPAAPTQISNPFGNYKCDLASLQAMNPGKEAAIAANFCCSTLNGDGSPKCQYGKMGTSCSAKQIDANAGSLPADPKVPWTVSVCPVESDLIPIATVKSRLDNFFLNLDGKLPTDDPNYFIVSIVPKTADTLTTLQASRNVNDSDAGQYITKAVDRGDRFLALGDLVANGSLALELGSTNYDTLLDEIGKTIVAKKGTFTLQREPTGFEEMQVFIVHADGAYFQVPAASLSISGKVLSITDLALVLSLKSTDYIALNYQPKSGG